MRPARAQPLPCLRSDPSGLRRVEAFWNSFSRGHTTAVLQSVPVFPLASASVGPRSFGKVRSEPRQAVEIQNVLVFFQAPLSSFFHKFVIESFPSREMLGVESFQIRGQSWEPVAQRTFKLFVTELGPFFPNNQGRAKNRCNVVQYNPWIIMLLTVTELPPKRPCGTVNISTQLGIHQLIQPADMESTLLSLIRNIDITPIYKETFTAPFICIGIPRSGTVIIRLGT